MIPQIIHKPDKIDRHLVLMSELEEQGIHDFKLWDGIHAKTVQMGVNLAHKQIVAWAKKKELSKVLIMEDDIKFCDKGAFEYYLRNEPSDYDLYLGGIYLGKIEDGMAKQFTAMHCYIVHDKFYDTFLSTPDDMHIDHALAGLGKYVVCDPFIAIQHNGYSDTNGQYCNWDSMFTNRNLYRYKKNQ